MNPSRVLILGGSGFLGRHVAARLAARGVHVVIPTRRRERARHLLTLPTADVVQSGTSAAELTALLDGCDAAINLVGILHGNQGEPYGTDFASTHVELPRRLAAACARTGARRLIHVSALGVNLDAATLPSMYLRSKADGERAVHQTEGIDWTVFRPSVVFGPQDQFMNMFAKAQRLAPFMPLPRAATRFQPVYVGDVAQAVVTALHTRATIGKTYELAGPDVFTLAELVQLAGRWSGHQRPVWALPHTLGQLQASILARVPGPTLMSRDNFDSMTVDNVATGPMAPELGLTPTPLASVAPLYLSGMLRSAQERDRARN